MSKQPRDGSKEDTVIYIIKHIYIYIVRMFVYIYIYITIYVYMLASNNTMRMMLAVQSPDSKVH